MTSAPASLPGATEVPRKLPPLVCGVDDGFIQPLCVMMESLAAAHPGGTGDMRLIVLNHALSKSSSDAIRWHADRLSLSVELRTAPAPSSRYPAFRWTSDATYMRLAIPEIITDHRKVLYLDVDLLILKDLRPLLEHDLSGAALAAVRDPKVPLLKIGKVLPGWERLGLSGNQEYFNNGVMLLDLPECRRQQIFARASDFLIEHPENVRYWDQDAMNWSAADNWLRLDRKWNTFALSPRIQLGNFIHQAESVIPLAQLLADEDTAAVLHFAGANKPWAAGFPDGPLRDLYAKFLGAVVGQQ
jgi:UDP-D-galactose:(glucosyl)LPS alpha-1,3-D-galactosyltransferase